MPPILPKEIIKASKPLMPSQQVVLVDHHDQPIGTCDKLRAHREGLLHRAFSVFIYRKKNKSKEILLQKRHVEKYHSGGLWTNACCSHPSPGETIEAAVCRRLKEELGLYFKQDQLQKAGCFHYCAEVGNCLIENEMDHVFMGEYLDVFDWPLKFNPEEISEVSWMEIGELKKSLQKNPADYTVWLEKALGFIIEYL